MFCSMPSDQDFSVNEARLAARPAASSSPARAASPKQPE